MDDSIRINGLGEEEQFYKRRNSINLIVPNGAIPLLVMMALTLFSDKEAVNQSAQEFSSTIGQLQAMLNSLKTTLSSLEQASDSWKAFESQIK